MKLPTFDTQDDVPEPFRSLYEERDGKWHPKPDDAAEQLAATLADEKAKREAAEKLATKTANELKKLQRKAEAGDHGLTDEQLTKLREDIRAEVMEEVGPDLEKAKQALAENRTLKLDNQVKAMAAEAGFLPTKLNDLWKLKGDEFDLTDDGKPMVKGKPGTDPKKHIEAIAKSMPEWVQGTKASGGGGMGGAGNKGASGGMDFDALVKNPRAALDMANAGTTD